MEENHFMVFFVDAGTDTVRIPNSFSQRNGRFLENSVTLRMCDQTTWVIHIEKTYGEIWLTVGWKQFAKDNGIKDSFAVYFYYGGHSLFDVTIYHTAAVENPSADYPLDSIPAKFFQPVINAERLRQLNFPKRFSTIFCQRLENPLFLNPGDGTVWPVHWRTVNRKICLYKGWEKVAAHLSSEAGDVCLFCYQGDRNISVTICRMSDDQLTPSYRRLVLDVPQLTLWTAEVTEYMLSKSKPLYIPVFVIKEYFSDKPKDMEIMVPSGRIQKWSFIWSSRETNEGYLGNGWYDFVIDYKLKLNQKIRFFQEYEEELIHVEVL